MTGAQSNGAALVMCDDMRVGIRTVTGIKLIAERFEKGIGNAGIETDSRPAAGIQKNRSKHEAINPSNSADIRELHIHSISCRYPLKC